MKTETTYQFNCDCKKNVQQFWKSLELKTIHTSIQKCPKNETAASHKTHCENSHCRATSEKHTWITSRQQNVSAECHFALSSRSRPSHGRAQNAPKFFLETKRQQRKYNHLPGPNSNWQVVFQDSSLDLKDILLNWHDNPLKHICNKDRKQQEFRKTSVTK